MARYIPERTVDSLVAIEIVRQDPFALVWSPSNSRHSFDHAVQSTGAALTILETKAVDINGAGAWTAPVDVQQLNHYCRLPFPVYYVFLGQPDNEWSPSWRKCSECGGDWCKTCPRDARSWSSLEPHVQRSDPRFRLQPWFGHWAWTVSAVSLAAFHTACRGGRTSWTVRAGGAGSAPDVTAAPGAARLCHFLDDPTHRTLMGLELGDVLGLLSAEQELNGNDEGDATPPVLVLREPS